MGEEAIIKERKAKEHSVKMNQKMEEVGMLFLENGVDPDDVVFRNGKRNVKYSLAKNESTETMKAYRISVAIEE